MKRTVNYLKGILKCIFLLLFFTSSAQINNNKVIAVKNTLNFPRNELISIPYRDFLKLVGRNTKQFRVLSKDSGKQYPYQLELLGKGEPQNVLILVDIPAKAEIQLLIETGRPDSIPAKTYARYVPERMDDFAWENDVVAFRMYGKALEGTKGDAQGLDIWVKRTNDLIIDKWYKSEDYHKDYGEGLDYYAVGQTLGAGDAAPYFDGEVRYPKHYREYEILDKGPLRTTFRLDFEPWKVGDSDVSVRKTISLDAGSQLNQISLNFDIEGRDELTIAAGIARRAGGEVLDKHKEGLFGYWEPQHKDDGITGVGLVFDKPVDSVKHEESQYLALFQVKSATPVRYFTGGAWNKAGRIQSASDWLTYLEQYKAILENPLEIKIN